MPKFTVLCRIDAFADYTAEVEADTHEEAAELASDNHDEYHWQADGVHEFDARVYFTLDADGEPIDATEVNDL